MSIYVLPLPWAERLIAQGQEIGEVPAYGSAAWFELPDTDRRKVAACVLAAEGWRRGYNGPFAPDTRGRDKRLRQIVEARQPRPGDTTGGPVQWDAVSDQ